MYICPELKHPNSEHLLFINLMSFIKIVFLYLIKMWSGTMHEISTVVGSKEGKVYTSVPSWVERLFPRTTGNMIDHTQEKYNHCINATLLISLFHNTTTNNNQPLFHWVRWSTWIRHGYNVQL